MSYGRRDRDGGRRVFVGGLPYDVREREIEDLFYKYGKIVDIMVKARDRGPAFAFVEFDDYRDAEDACRGRDGIEFGRRRIRVEIARGRQDRGGERRERRRPQRSEFRMLIKGLPQNTSWQDVKDFVRDLIPDATIGYTNVQPDGSGAVEFSSQGDLDVAMKKMSDTDFKNRNGKSAESLWKEI